jgi:hypothetical protein
MNMHPNNSNPHYPSWDQRFHDQAIETIRARNANRIPPFTGRPERDTVINPDDITNLQIALGTARTVEELCEVI